MTPQQLVDDLQKRQALFDIAVAHTDAAPVPGMNPLVAEAMAGGAPAPSSASPNPFLGAAQSLAPKVAASEPAPAPGKAADPVTASPVVNPVTPAPAVDTPSANSFYDMLLMNDAYRLRNKESFERNEKANKARTTIAAISDALASLGNLVGTTQGAFSQPQTYQTPFVTEQVEADRKEARKLAQAIEDNDMSLRLTKAKYDEENGLYGNRLALEQAKTDRALALALERAKLAEQNAGYKSELEGTKHGYRTDEIAQRGEIQKEVTQMRNEQSDINNRRSTGTSAANNIRTNDRIRETGGSGGVGGYTTSETITYDDLGRKTGSTKTRTANGQTTTTTTTTPGGANGSQSASGKKPNPMGSAPQPEAKKKKKNPMN